MEYFGTILRRQSKRSATRTIIFRLALRRRPRIIVRVRTVHFIRRDNFGSDQNHVTKNALLYRYMTSATAILVFARTAAEESKHKHFCADPGRNHALLAALGEQTLSMARATPYPVFHLTEKEQRGSDFGQRISNAAADIFSRGYERLIILGNDCPTISPALLQKAGSLLHSGTSVLGPDQRGGAYLIGLTQEDFCAQCFARLPWQTPRVLHELQKQLSHPVLLTMNPDLNDRTDLERLSGLTFRYRILARLLRLLREDGPVSPSGPVSPRKQSRPPRRFDRGPPADSSLLDA